MSYLFFERGNWSLELKEQWSQFFQTCNWYTFNPIVVEFENNRHMGDLEIRIVLLGLGFRISWTHNPNAEMRRDLRKQVSEVEEFEKLWKDLADPDLADPGELAHWVAAPMRDVGTFEQFHDVVDRAELIIARARSREVTIAELDSFRKNVTGIDNTLFISAQGHLRVAIDPPDSLDPQYAAAIAIFGGEVSARAKPEVAGTIDPRLVDQVLRFVRVNQAALWAYWNFEIDTDQLLQRLKPVEPCEERSA